MDLHEKTTSESFKNICQTPVIVRQFSNQNLENPVSTDSPTETNTVLNTPMSPATRQRKHRLASEITRILNVISVNDQIDVIFKTASFG